jgi:glutamate racemase
MTIGVFDSGVGGLSVAHAVQAALPHAKIILKEDKENLPYGNKTSDQLFALVTPILEGMVEQGCEVIVVACNTVTTSIIGRLREVIKVPLVGMEPMVKPAAEQTKTKKIAVFATPTTLASARYAELKEKYADGVEVIEPDCSKWSYMVEHSQVEEDQIKANVDAVLSAGADVIVLGCTHYHWIEGLIKSLSGGKATVLQPEQPVIAQLKRVLEGLNG